MKKIIRKGISCLLAAVLLAGCIGTFEASTGSGTAEAASTINLYLTDTPVSSGDHLAAFEGGGYFGLCAKAFYRGYLGNHTYTLYDSSKYCQNNLMKKLAYYYGYQRGWTSGVNGSKLARCFNYVNNQSDSTITGTAYFYPESTFKEMVNTVKNISVPSDFDVKFAIPTGNTRWQSAVIWKMKPALQIVKTSSDSKTSGLSQYDLKGIKFGVYTKKNTDSAYKKGTLTVGSDGKTGTLSLPAGTYYINEDYIPSGSNYKPAGWQEVKLESAITATDTVKTVTIKDSPVTGSLTFTKKIKDGGDASGFEFMLTHKEDSTIQYKATSDGNGKVSFSGLYLGDYTLTEIGTTKTDRFYYPQSDMPDAVTITSGTNKINDSNTFVNESEVRGGIVIQKIIDGEGSPKGWKFEIEKDGEFYCKGTTDKAGFLSIYDLHAGTYTIKEILSDTEKAKYKTSYSTQTVVISEENAAEAIHFVKVTNTERRASLTVTKNCLDGNIAGVTFKVKGTTAAGEAYEEDMVTDAAGLATKVVPAGKYKVIESSFNSNNYKLNDDYENATVDGVKCPAQGLQISGDEKSGVSMDFTNLPYRIKLSKKAMNFDGELTDIPVPGAVYELHEVNSGNLVFLECKTTDENGELEFDTTLEYGKTYNVYETVYPQGFIEEKPEEGDPGVLKKTITVDGTKDVYKIKDSNKFDYGMVMGLKYDEDSPLQPVEGATYTLYTDSECTEVAKDKDGNKCVGKTDNYGTIMFENLGWSLDGTDYYMKETKAPKGYEVSDEVITYNLGYNEDAGEYQIFALDSEILEPRKKGAVELTKTDEDGDRLLNDAVYSLYKADGTLVKDKLVTGKDNDGDGNSDGTGKIKVSDLEWGKYYFLEDEAPDGYALSDEKKTFAVNAYSVDNIQKLTVRDKVQTTIVTATKKIKAEDIHFDHGTPTFTFKLTGKTVEGKDVTKYKMVTFSESYIQSHTDTEEYVSMSATFSDLEAGDYTLTEESVSRYTLEHIEANPMNGTISGGSVIFEGLDKNKNGAATFVNKKYEWGDDSDTTATVNNLKREAKLTSLFADCENIVYEGNAIINWSDILEVYAIYDVGTEKELKESEYEIVDVEGNVVKSGSHLPKEAGSYVYTVKYEEGGVLATATVSLDVSAAKLYTVKFDTQGGSSLSDMSVYKYDTIKSAAHGSETLYTTTKTGYSFTGWFTDYTEGSYANRFEVTDLVTSDMNLHAKWDEKTYSVYFNGNGATGGSQVTLTRLYTKSVTLPETTNYIRTGYTFDGWYTAATGGDVITEVKANTAKNITAYAHWKESSAPQGGIEVTNNVEPTQTATISGTASSGVNSYYFGTDSSPSSSDYTALKTSDTEFSKDITLSDAGTYYLFVKSEAGQISEPVSVTMYKTTLNANGGSITPASVLTEENQSFKMPAATFTDLEFIGWSFTKDAGLTDEWVDSKAMYVVTENTTLYAQGYDVDTLEKAISGSVRSGDIKLGSQTNLTKTSINAASNASVAIKVTVDNGYQMIGGLPYWYTGDVWVHPYGATSSQNFVVRNRYDSAKTVTPKVSTLEVYKRTGVVSTGDVDARIANMQNIADACLSYKIADGDLKISSNYQAMTFTTNTYKSTNAISTSGYRNICLAGFDLDKASGNGYFAATGTYGMYTSQLGILSGATSSITLDAYTWELQERIKSVGTRTAPTFGSYATAAQNRLEALNSLAASEKKFFKYSNCKMLTNQVTGVTTSNGNASYKQVSFSGYERMVCPVGFYTWNNGGSGCSFTMPKAVRFLDYSNDSSATFYFQYTGVRYGNAWRGPSGCSSILYTFVIDK